MASFCTACGTAAADGWRFCAQCGGPVSTVFSGPAGPTIPLPAEVGISGTPSLVEGPHSARAASRSLLRADDTHYELHPYLDDAAQSSELITNFDFRVRTQGRELSMDEKRLVVDIAQNQTCRWQVVYLFSAAASSDEGAKAESDGWHELYRRVAQPLGAAVPHIAQSLNRQHGGRLLKYAMDARVRYNKSAPPRRTAETQRQLRRAVWLDARGYRNATVDALNKAMFPPRTVGRDRGFNFHNTEPIGESTPQSAEGMFDGLDMASLSRTSQNPASRRSPSSKPGYKLVKIVGATLVALSAVGTLGVLFNATSLSGALPNLVNITLLAAFGVATFCRAMNAIMLGWGYLALLVFMTVAHGFIPMELLQCALLFCFVLYLRRQLA